MANGQDVESILVVEAGNVTTRAVLIDQVEGVHRFIAKGESPSTLAAPHADFRAGLRDAIRQLEEIAGRMLLNDRGELISPERPNGYGVDTAVITSSVLPPLRVVIAGLIRDLSVESARRAVQSTYAVVQDIVALNEGPQRWGAKRGMEAKLESLCQNPPDVVVLVGGTDDGAESPLLDISRILVTAASAIDASKRPVVIFAGNQRARPSIAELLADHFEFRAVDNVRPQLDVEVLSGVQQELESLYSELVIKRLPGLESVSNWSSIPIVPSAKAFELMVKFVARQYRLVRGVLGASVGGGSTQLLAALAERSYGLVKSNFGLSHGLEALNHAAADHIVRWLPFEATSRDVHNRLLNKYLYPLSVPQTREDLLLEQAAACEALSIALTELRSCWGQTQQRSNGLLPPLDLIIASGGVLAQAPNPGQAALILLNALQPVGLCRLVLDQLSLLSPLGAVAMLHPLAAAQVLDRDGFVELGTVVSPVGEAKEGEIALRFKMQYADNSTIQVEVPYGSLEVIPLPPGQVATLELHPTRKFDVGWGRPGQGGKVEVQGGSVGVIIDARGRPLTLSSKPEVQQTRVQEWLWSIGG